MKINDARGARTLRRPPAMAGGAAGKPRYVSAGSERRGRDVHFSTWASARECIAALGILVTAAAADVGAARSADGVEETFARSCAGCHVNGGNVLDGSKTLSSRDLERNLGAINIDAVSGIIANGRNRMPGYGTDCAPKGACTFGPRLSDEEIRCVFLFFAFILVSRQCASSSCRAHVHDSVPLIDPRTTQRCCRTRFSSGN